MHKLISIVLAAGQSKRMGDVNKLLLQINGKALVTHMVERCERVSQHAVIVVTGFEKDKLRKVLFGRNVTIVHNDEFEQGQMTSVDVGLRSAPEAENYLLALGDQPFVSEQDILSLLNAHKENGGSRITIPFVNGQRGNPIVIPFLQREKILADPINLGCRKLTRQSAEDVHQYHVCAPSFVADIDTIEDFHRAQVGLAEAGGVF